MQSSQLILHGRSLLLNRDWIPPQHPVLYMAGLTAVVIRCTETTRKRQAWRVSPKVPPAFLTTQVWLPSADCVDWYLICDQEPMRFPLVVNMISSTFLKRFVYLNAAIPRRVVSYRRSIISGAWTWIISWMDRSSHLSCFYNRTA